MNAEILVALILAIGGIIGAVAGAVAAPWAEAKFKSTESSTKPNESANQSPTLGGKQTPNWRGGIWGAAIGVGIALLGMGLIRTELDPITTLFSTSPTENISAPSISPTSPPRPSIGNAFSQLVETPTPTHTPIPPIPTLSPASPTPLNQDQLVYCRLIHDGNDCEIVLLDLQSMEEKILRTTYGYEPGLAWSPDGNQLTFVSEFQGYSQIYLLDLTDNSESLLTTSHYNKGQSAWSPDGRYIVYAVISPTDERAISLCISQIHKKKSTNWCSFFYL